MSHLVEQHRHVVVGRDLVPRRSRLAPDPDELVHKPPAGELSPACCDMAFQLAAPLTISARFSAVLLAESCSVPEGEGEG